MATRREPVRKDFTDVQRLAFVKQGICPSCGEGRIAPTGKVSWQGFPPDFYISNEYREYECDGCKSRHAHISLTERITIRDEVRVDVQTPKMFDNYSTNPKSFGVVLHKNPEKSGDLYDKIGYRNVFFDLGEQRTFAINAKTMLELMKWLAENGFDVRLIGNEK